MPTKKRTIDYPLPIVFNRNIVNTNETRGICCWWAMPTLRWNIEIPMYIFVSYKPLSSSNFFLKSSRMSPLEALNKLDDFKKKLEEDNGL